MIDMKDSGIDWIGKIPAHWELIKMCDMFNFGQGLSITKADLEETGVAVISYGQVHSEENLGVGLNKKLVRYKDCSRIQTRSAR